MTVLKPVVGMGSISRNPLKPSNWENVDPVDPYPNKECLEGLVVFLGSFWPVKKPSVVDVEPSSHWVGGQNWVTFRFRRLLGSAISQDCHQFSPWKWKNIEKQYPFSAQTQISLLSTNVPKSLPIIVDWVPTWEKPMVSFFSAVVRSFGFSSTPTKWRVGTFHRGCDSKLGDYIEFNLKSGHLKCFNGTNHLQSAYSSGMAFCSILKPIPKQFNYRQVLWCGISLAQDHVWTRNSNSCSDSSVWEN